MALHRRLRGRRAAATALGPGRAGAAVWAMVAVGAAGVCGSVVVRHGLGAGGRLFAVIALVFLVSFTFAASVLLRRPAVAMPGLLGGLFVALAWLAMQGFTFAGVIAPMTAPFAPLVPVIGVPLLVGVAGTLWGGSAVAGRRIARLAAISAGLGLYLYGTIAVAVVGAGGPPEDMPGWTVSDIISDRLGNNLTGLPVASAGTARGTWVRPRQRRAEFPWIEAPGARRLSRLR